MTPPAVCEDAEIFVGDAKSDAEWFAAILRQHEEPLVVYVARIMRNREVARDVVQEAFLKLIQAERREIGPRVVEWLYTVCRNKSLDLRRKERRTPPREDFRECRPAVSSAPGDRMEWLEFADELSRLLTRLPENQQLVIRLRFQQGWAYQRISKETGLSVSNVGFLLHVGLKSLRERMKAGGLLFRQQRSVR